MAGRKGAKGGGNGTFMPIGFELFAIMTRFFKPVDIIAVARGNRKLGRGNWHKSAEEGNYFLGLQLPLHHEEANR